MSLQVLEFSVIGVPAPGGSKRGFYNAKIKRVMIVDACARNKPWREAVRWAAIEAMKHAGIRTGQCFPLQGPIRLDVIFWMPRPKGHYRTGNHAGKLRENAPLYPVTKPDRTKLLRALEDALTDSGIWKDDTQVVSGDVSKRYTTREARADVVVYIQS